MTLTSVKKNLNTVDNRKMKTISITIFIKSCSMIESMILSSKRLSLKNLLNNWNWDCTILKKLKKHEQNRRKRSIKSSKKSIQRQIKRLQLHIRQKRFITIFNNFKWRRRHIFKQNNLHIIWHRQSIHRFTHRTFRRRRRIYCNIRRNTHRNTHRNLKIIRNILLFLYFFRFHRRLKSISIQDLWSSKVDQIRSKMLRRHSFKAVSYKTSMRSNQLLLRFISSDKLLAISMTKSISKTRLTIWKQNVLAWSKYAN